MTLPKVKVWAVTCNCGINPLSLTVWSGELNADGQWGQQDAGSLHKRSEFIYRGALGMDIMSEWAPCPRCLKAVKWERVWFEQLFNAVEEWKRADSVLGKNMMSDQVIALQAAQNLGNK
jgi:hypothetical protein